MSDLSRLCELDDDGLLEHRSALFDRSELCDREGEVHRWLRAELALVDAVVLAREAGAHAAVDPRRFAEALVSLIRARRQLGLPLDPKDTEEVFAVACQIASRQRTEDEDEDDV